MKGLISLAYLETIGLTSKELQLFNKIDTISNTSNSNNLYETDRETLIEFLKFAMNYTFSARNLITKIHGSICYFKHYDNELDELDLETHALLNNSIIRDIFKIESFLFACAKKLGFSCDFEYSLLDFSKLKPLHNVERYEFVIKLFYTIRFFAVKINDFLGLNIDLEFIDLSLTIRDTLSKDFRIPFSITKIIDDILNLERGGKEWQIAI